MTMTRPECLRVFLELFGPLQLAITREAPEEIRARVRWLDDPDWQEIRWPVPEDRVPSPETLEIARYVASHGLLDIDQITVSRNELYARMRSDIAIPWSQAEFDVFLEQLLSIEVPWVENGADVDAFFVHE